MGFILTDPELSRPELDLACFSGLSHGKGRGRCCCCSGVIGRRPLVVDAAAWAAAEILTTLHGTDTTLLGRDPGYGPAI